MCKQLPAIFLGVLAAIPLMACTGAPATPESIAQKPTATEQPSMTEPRVTPTQAEPTEAPEPTEVPSLPEPQRIEFDSEDGTPLVGMYYAPAVGPAPGILLMHQMGVSKEIWEPLIAALRGEPTAAQRTAPLAAPASEGRGYAIFAFDIPDHGESGGDFTDAAMLAAARTALQLFRTMDGVDPDTIVMVGASVGADASVDECNEGCIAAIPISPGSYLGVDFNSALEALKEEKDPPVLCIAAQDDAPSAYTCQSGESVGLTDYQIHIYEGRGHGNFLFFEETLAPPPHIIDLIMQWLDVHLPR